MAERKAEGEIKAVINLIKGTSWALEKAMNVLKIDNVYKEEI